MKIPFSKTRIFSTSELPGVICDPLLRFEFPAAPTFEQVEALSKWSTGKKTSRGDTIALAKQFLLAVEVPDGDRYELGTTQTIIELIGQTEFTFVVNLLRGWQTRISLERALDLKNFKASLGGSSVNGAAENRASASSAS